MAEAARRNCYTGEIQAQHVGLPVDEMVTVVDGAEVVTT